VSYYPINLYFLDAGLLTGMLKLNGLYHFFVSGLSTCGTFCSTRGVMERITIVRSRTKCCSNAHASQNEKSYGLNVEG